MPFGYMPHKSWWKDLILRVFGQPNLIRRIQAPVIMKIIDPGESELILDAGCGGGFFAYEIAKRCHNAIGVDLNLNSSLYFAMEKYPNVTYIKCNLEKLPFTSGKFDKILLSSVLQVVENDAALLQELFWVLKGEGILVLSVPVEYIHFKRLNQLKPQIQRKFRIKGKGYYKYDQIIKLLKEEGFEILEAEYSPKKWGSFIFETTLDLSQRFGVPYNTPFLFLLLYPLVYFDRFADKKQMGSEIIIKARKVSR